MTVGEPGAAVSGALLLMCEVWVLDGLIRAAQPSGSNSRIHPVPGDRFNRDLAVRTRRPGEVDRDEAGGGLGRNPLGDGPLPRLLEIGCLGLEHKCVRFGQGVARNGNGVGRQIRHQYLELAVGLGRVGLSHSTTSTRT